MQRPGTHRLDAKMDATRINVRLIGRCGERIIGDCKRGVFQTASQDRDRGQRRRIIDRYNGQAFDGGPDPPSAVFNRDLQGPRCRGAEVL